MLQAFSVVFSNAIDSAAPEEDIKQRVLVLIDTITYFVFNYTTRGLFECDKLTFTAQMTFLVSFPIHYRIACLLQSKGAFQLFVLLFFLFNLYFKEIFINF